MGAYLRACNLHMRCARAPCLTLQAVSKGSEASASQASHPGDLASRSSNASTLMQLTPLPALGTFGSAQRGQASAAAQPASSGRGAEVQGHVDSGSFSGDLLGAAVLPTWSTTTARADHRHDAHGEGSSPGGGSPSLGSSYGELVARPSTTPAPAHAAGLPTPAQHTRPEAGGRPPTAPVTARQAAPAVFFGSTPHLQHGYPSPHFIPQPGPQLYSHHQPVPHVVDLSPTTAWPHAHMRTVAVQVGAAAGGGAMRGSWSAGLKTACTCIDPVALPLRRKRYACRTAQVGSMNEVSTQVSYDDCLGRLVEGAGPAMEPHLPGLGTQQLFGQARGGRAQGAHPGACWPWRWW